MTNLKIIHKKNTYRILNNSSILDYIIFKEFNFEPILYCDASQYLNCKLYIENRSLILKELGIEYGEKNEPYPVIDGINPTVTTTSQYNYPILHYKNLSRKINIPRNIIFGTKFLKKAYQINRKKYNVIHPTLDIIPPVILSTSNKIWYDNVYQAYIKNGKITKVVNVTKSIKSERRLQIGQNILNSNSIIRKIIYLSKKWVLEYKDKLHHDNNEVCIDKTIEILIQKMKQLPSINHKTDKTLNEISKLSLKWIHRYYYLDYRRRKTTVKCGYEFLWALPPWRNDGIFALIKNHILKNRP